MSVVNRESAVNVISRRPSLILQEHENLDIQVFGLVGYEVEMTRFSIAEQIAKRQLTYDRLASRKFSDSMNLSLHS